MKVKKYLYEKIHDKLNMEIQRRKEIKTKILEANHNLKYYKKVLKRYEKQQDCQMELKTLRTINKIYDDICSLKEEHSKCTKKINTYLIILGYQIMKEGA
jgi:hypothetical protein